MRLKRANETLIKDNLMNEINGNSSELSREVDVTHADACLSEINKTEKQVGESIMLNRLTDCGGELNPEEGGVNWLIEVLPIVETIWRKGDLSCEAIGLLRDILAKTQSGLFLLDYITVTGMRPTWGRSVVVDILSELSNSQITSCEEAYLTGYLDIDELKERYSVLFGGGNESNIACIIRLLDQLPKYEKEAVLHIYGCWTSEICSDYGDGWERQPFALNAESIQVLLDASRLGIEFVCAAIGAYGNALSTECTCVRPVMDLGSFIDYTEKHGTDLWDLIVDGALDFQNVAVD
jgi:hypothetical protein